MKKQIAQTNVGARNYANSKIFMIQNEVDSQEFFGTTTQKYLSDVKAYYRNRLKNRKLTNCILEKMKKHGFQKFSFILLEEYQCSSKK